MDKFDRIFSLHNILHNRRRPVPIQTIMERLECSERTARRIIHLLRDGLGAPVDYDKGLNGWFYRRDETGPYELPGLWFNPGELYALLVSCRLLAEVQPGLLGNHIEPLKHRIETILEHRRASSVEVAQRIRILQIAARPTDLHYFQQIAGAVLQRKQVRILYHGRARDETTERTVSPQRLVYYRSNWYLDAWCHLRRGLRSFSLDRLHPVEIIDQPAKEISDKALDSHYADAYGIFAGPAKKMAVLRFSPDAARWVADEHWHPLQAGKVLSDGSYELEIPYNNPRELMMDILKYGPDVVVKTPKSLQKAIAERLKNAAARYG